MPTDGYIKGAAIELRQAIESGNREVDINYAMSRLVEALGGQPVRTAPGRPEIQAAYLIALVLTLPIGGQR